MRLINHSLCVLVFTHFRFVFECIVATVTDAMEVGGALPNKRTKVRITFLRCPKTLKPKRNRNIRIKRIEMV